MNVEEEIQRLRGEALASQMVIMGVCIGLSNLGGPYKAIVEQAFDYAEHTINVGIMKLGDQIPQVHLESVNSVLEQLRAVALGSGGKPKDAV